MNVSLFIFFSLLLFISPSLHLGPGPGPFGNTHLPQPVGGAPRGKETLWRFRKICDVTKSPFLARGDGLTINTIALQRAIDVCSLGKKGGTVLFPEGSGVFVSGSLFLKSNVTIRIEKGATLKGSWNINDNPIVYTRRESVMMDAHAGLLNGGRCVRKKHPLVGWDDCAEWTKISNVVIEGDGTIDGTGETWLEKVSFFEDKYGIKRPCLLDLLWVDGLTIRDLKIRNPGFWTVHPCFSNNIRITGLDIYTRGHNTDGIDPDSSWNVFIGNNVIDTGDDCIAIKAGRDWSGLKVNISTQNVLVEDNVFRGGHGISVGSETSGWIQHVAFKNFTCDHTRHAVRIKSCNGRGGGVKNIVYDGISGTTIREAIQLGVKYVQSATQIPEESTNLTATPRVGDIFIRNLNLRSPILFVCSGTQSNAIRGIHLENVQLAEMSLEEEDQWVHYEAEELRKQIIENLPPYSFTTTLELRLVYTQRLANFTSSYCNVNWNSIHPEPHNLT